MCAYKGEVGMKRLIIEKDNLCQNINIIKSMSSSKIIAVLKGNGYGLGMLEFATFLLEKGIDMFAVSDIEDAICLSEEGFSGKVLLLTPTNLDDEAELIVKNKIIPSIGSITSALVINDAALRLDEVVDFHLKIDTGFGRFGLLADEITEFCTLLKTMENLQIAGTYSHFSFSFSKKEKDVYSQYNKFINAVELIKENGLNPGMLHICNSSAFLRFPQMHLDAVRIGSAFLGRIPIVNTYGLEKIGYLKSRIIETKELPKNHNIGYANTYKTRNATRIGIVPVGYLDGFGVEKSRDTFRPIDILRYIYNDIKMFNKKYYVDIGGKHAPVLGRISTYNIIVDLTGINAKIGDEVKFEVNTMLVPEHILREYV
jgi:alanine racemase